MQHIPGIDRWPSRIAVVAEYCDRRISGDPIKRMTVVVTSLESKDISRKKILAHQEWWVDDHAGGLSEVQAEVDSYLGHISGQDLVVVHVENPVPLERALVPGVTGRKRTGWKSSAMYHADYLKFLASSRA